MSHSQHSVEVVQRMLDAFNGGDVDAVIAAFDDGCEINEPPEMPDSPAVGYRGHDGIRAWMGNLRGVAGAVRAPALRTEWRLPALRAGVDRARARKRGPGRVDDLCGVRGARGKITRIQVFLSRPEAIEAVGLSE